MRWESRANLDEPYPELNAKFVEQFIAVPGFWGAGKTASDAPFESTDESASLDLRTALVSGLGGQVLYAPRFAGYLSRDIAQSDDFIWLRLDTEEADHVRFCSATLPRLIEVFGSYRAAARTDDAVKLADFDITRVQSQKTGRNIDGRDSVYRIWPVCFFDDLLCRRAFGIGAAEVAARRAGVRARRGAVWRRVPAGDVGDRHRTGTRRAECPRHGPARQRRRMTIRVVNAKQRLGPQPFEGTTLGVATYARPGMSAASWNTAVTTGGSSGLQANQQRPTFIYALPGWARPG